MTQTPAGPGKGSPRVLFRGVAVPDQFPYLSVLLQGRPRHGWDDFALRHPQMERGKRAKLFAPYDALDGYSAHVKEKNILYTGRIVLDEEERAELNRRLSILRDLSRTSRLAKANRVRVTVRFYVPCADPYSFSYQALGRYEEVSGLVRRLDAEEKRALIVDDRAIPFDDILSVTAEDESVFARRWDEG